MNPCIFALLWMIWIPKFCINICLNECIWTVDWWWRIELCSSREGMSSQNIFNILQHVCKELYKASPPPKKKIPPPSDGFRPIFTRSLTVFHVVQVSKWSAWFTNNIFEYDNKLEVCMYVWVILHTLLANIPRKFVFNSREVHTTHMLRKKITFYDDFQIRLSGLGWTVLELY